jgi:KDO2-lipid IV(A) lauroyltransferase
MFEFSAFASLTPARVRDLVTLDGIEHLNRALARGRGVVFVTGHYGNWELFGAAIAANGIPIDFLVGEQTNRRVDDVMNELRRRQGIGIITRAMALRKVLQALTANHMVAMLADQDARRQGIMVDFLGRPASTVRGPAVFALRRQSPLVTGFVHREGTRHRAVFNPPIDPAELPDGLAEEEAIRRLTQAHADSLAKGSAESRSVPVRGRWAPA